MKRKSMATAIIVYSVLLGLMLSEPVAFPDRVSAQTLPPIDYDIVDDRVFTLWAIRPDGSGFEPFSGFGDGPFAHHFMTQISAGPSLLWAARAL